MNRLLFVVLASAACSFWIQATLASQAATEEVLYSFCGTVHCADGGTPPGALVSVKGVLYGTATSFGASGGGVIFSLAPQTGVETTLYSFQKNGTDGFTPFAGLFHLSHILYGTTEYGGSTNYGTVFSFNPATGIETVLHSFQNDGVDGDGPFAGLTSAKGILYGTTASGGTYNQGAVFSLDPATGTETVLHSFIGGTDGAIPVAGLVDVNGVLYGTSYHGGREGYGVVFSIDLTTGSESVLHSFGKGTDGSYPQADLKNIKGKLYGTTFEGGAYGSGAIFSINLTTGKEKVLYSFQNNGSDGTQPVAGLTHVNGILYGTTSKGGSGGEGTVFSLDPRSGIETVLHSFVTGKDGTVPGADLLNVKGVLYGTTYYGGQSNAGTVFEIVP